MPDNNKKMHKGQAVKMVVDAKEDYYNNFRHSASRARPKPKNRKKKVNPKYKQKQFINRAKALGLIIAASIIGTTFFSSIKDKLFLNIGYQPPVNDPTITDIGDNPWVDDVINNNDASIDEDSVTIERKYDRLDFINYREHCYQDTYGGQKYLFLTDDFMYELAEYALDSLDSAFIQAGKKPIDGSSTLPAFLTEEFLMGVTYSESSKRVCTLDGRPLKLPEGKSPLEYNGAIGVLQQKPEFREDGDKYIRSIIGREAFEQLYEGLDVDGADPLISMYRAIANYTRYYHSYLYNGSNAQQLIGEENVYIGAIACYNQGEGAFASWMKKDRISKFWDYAQKSVYVNNIKRHMLRYQVWALESEYRLPNDKERPHILPEFDHYDDVVR